MKKLTLCLAITAFAAHAVSAEPPIGSRLGERTEKREQKRESDSAISAHEMARCMLDRKPKEVRAFLAATSAEASESASRKLNTTLDCFALGGDENAEMTMVMFPTDIMRGMLAEEAIKASHRSYEQLPALTAQRSYSRSWYPVSGRALAVDEMATCAVETNPIGVLALIDSRPYSDGERAAINAIAPSLGACLVAGAKVDANRQALRAALADALYQRLINSRDLAPVPISKISERGQ